MAEKLRGDAFAALREGRFTDARKLLESHVESNPDDADAWRLLGHALAGLEKPDEARDAFQRAIAGGSLHPDTLQQLLRLELDAEQIPAALNAARLLALIEPGNREVSLFLADIASAHGSHQEARAIYETYLKSDRSAADVWRRYADLLRRQEDVPGAICALRMADMVGERSAELCELIAQLIWTDGDPARAARWYARAMRLQPERSEQAH